MKAILARACGGPEVLTLEDIDQPTLVNGQGANHRVPPMLLATRDIRVTAAADRVARTPVIDVHGVAKTYGALTPSRT